MSQLELLPDLVFDYPVIVEQIAKAQRRNRKVGPAEVHLNAAITSMTLTDTIEGSSTLEIGLADPNFEFMDYFDADGNGRVDKIDFNYPLDSPNWWRLSQISVSSPPTTLNLTFMERPVAYLLHKYGPKKASRGKMTRAEFFQSLVKEVKADKLRFHSKELHKKQPVAGTTQVLDDDERRTQKGQGLHKNEDVTIKGIKADEKQLKEATILMDVGAHLHAPERAIQAILCAAIGESTMRAVPNATGSNYWGVLQGNKNTFEMNDTAGMAECFYKGGKGFQGGGAIEIVSKHEDWGPGLIAVTIEGSRSNFGSDEAAENHYGQWAQEADALIEAYGGGFSGGTTYYRQQFNFQIGTEEEPKQSYWDGMTSLAEDVRWRLFCDGRTIYFDSDMTLIKQKPLAIIRRTGEELVSFSATWDDRKICTECQIDLVCEPFAFRAGEVLKLQGFGLLSNGSTAKLPGRWLISEIERQSGSVYSSFTLVQPTKPRKEPATERVPMAASETEDYDLTGVSGELRERICEIAKQSMCDSCAPYSQNGVLTDKVHAQRSKGERSDCSQWVRAVYLQAGADDPGTYTGAMLEKGRETDKPKPGDLLCSPSHVELFIGNGKTIGHGSDPIDGDTVQAVKGRDSGMRFITFDFLDHELTNQELSSKYGWGY